MKWKIVLSTAVAAVAAACFLWPRGVSRTGGPMPNAAYVWQRAWTDSVTAALAEHSDQFTEIIALAAEVSWRNQEPRILRVALDYPALAKTDQPVGLALRIGTFGGPFRADDTRARALGDLTGAILAEAATNHVRVAELQLDFDCAESKLEGYRVWVDAIRRRLGSVPLTITALPAWLKRPAFKSLVAATDGYVLQVHSLERPRSVNAAFTLCDLEAARVAVERAARVGKPFRVALPTYGYRVAFDAKGGFAGLSAEGPEKIWPAGTHFREIRSDPNEIAALVVGWKRDRPQALTGLIWYRLPVPGESLNWRWPTLAAVMNGEIPRGELQVEMRQPQTALVEVDLVNSGRADCRLPKRVALSWSDARLLAADSLQDFELLNRGNHGVEFTRSPAEARIEPGERRMIGWVRFDRKAEVRIDLE